VNRDQNLYIAVADALSAKERGAIKKYIQIAKEQTRG
jgi:hypothetical protein